MKKLLLFFSVIAFTAQAMEIDEETAPAGVELLAETGQIDLEAALEPNDGEERGVLVFCSKLGTRSNRCCGCCLSACDRCITSNKGYYGAQSCLLLGVLGCIGGIVWIVSTKFFD